MSHKYLFIFATIVVVYMLGLGITPMDIDASQYASISKELVGRDTWLHFYDRGVPYLDKPPLLFWLAAFSYKLLNISNVAYKLPTFGFWLLGLWATYHLAALYYDKSTARLSALILATTQAAFLMLNDVRTDTLLTSNVVLSIYFLAAATKKNNIFYYLLGFVSVSLAMLSKGPIGAIVPAMALGGHWILAGEWRNILRWQWLLGVVVVAVGLLPMSYGLYTQFDLHPEGVVNGKTGVSGLRFFYWTQSFGRITGESTWENKTDPFFLVHTTLWAFLPWSFILFAALFWRMRLALTASHLVIWLEKRVVFIAKIIEKIKNPTAETPVNEWISLSGFILPLIALSLSRYKLPHYIFVAYPMAAIFTAAYINHFLSKNELLAQRWLRVQTIIACVLGVALIVLCGWSFYNIYFLIFNLAVCGLIYALYTKPTIQNLFKTLFDDFTSHATLGTLLAVSTIIIIAVNILLGGYLYPTLLQYQAPSQAAHYANQQRLQPLYDASETGYASLYFVSQTPVKTIKITDLDSLFASASSMPHYVYGDDRLVEYLRKQNKMEWKIVQTFNGFPVTHLKFKFLNPQRRSELLQKSYWLQLSHPKSVE